MSVFYLQKTSQFIIAERGGFALVRNLRKFMEKSNSRKREKENGVYNWKKPCFAE